MDGKDGKNYSYRFNHWNSTDIFIYFSHHRLTIPPPSYTNIAHQNGVKSLGTFITEGDEGLIDNEILLADK